MALGFDQVSVPVFARGLRNLRHVLQKGADHAAARKIEESVLLASRLFPDMRPLTFQVQVATDIARGACFRLIGQDPPSFEDNETTFAQLYERIERNIALIEGLDRKAFDGAGERQIVRPVRGKPHTFTGQSYLMEWAMPNFYFHCTTAYALLRHNGVELGKADFLGKFE